jgi:acyl-ACP thioesterase
MNKNYPGSTYVSFKVRQDECDFKHNLTASSLIGYLQEAAVLASVESGYSIPEFLEKHNITWLLTRFVINILDSPKFGDEVHIETYASKIDKFYTQRDFLVLVNGACVAKAGSLWLLVNILDKKLARPTDFDIQHLLNTSHGVFEIPTNKMGTIQNPNNEYEIHVKWHDLDINEHTNNRHYFRWALDAVPTETLNNKTLKSLDFHFRSESVLGDKLIIQCEKLPDSDRFLHKISHQNGTEAIRGESVFE